MSLIKSMAEIVRADGATTGVQIPREAKIQIRNLNAFYGKQHAIADINLDIYPGLITAIIGPSGCGKSTMIRCINRMHEVINGAHASGSVLVDGDDIYAAVADPIQIRRRIGMVFQKPNPFPTKTVYENVIAGLRLNMPKQRKSYYDDVVERSLESAALWDEVKDKLNVPGTALSGGQQQRLCIARALAIEPEILLLDEPASALDPTATLKIEDLLFTLKQKYTIVLVTHNMQQAARASDMTAFFIADDDHKGRLVEYEVTKEIFMNPKDKRTEDYISGRLG